MILKSGIYYSFKGFLAGLVPLRTLSSPTAVVSISCQKRHIPESFLKLQGPSQTPFGGSKKPCIETGNLEVDWLDRWLAFTKHHGFLKTFLGPLRWHYWPALSDLGCTVCPGLGCHGSQGTPLLSSPPTAQASPCLCSPSCNPFSQLLSGSCFSSAWTGIPKNSGKRMLGTCTGWSLGEERSGKQPNVYVSGCALADWTLDL